MRLKIYIILTILYIFLMITGIFIGARWYYMIWIVYGVVHFGSRVMDLLEEQGL